MAAQKHQIISMYIKNTTRKEKMYLGHKQCIWHHLCLFLSHLMGRAREHMVGLKMDGGRYGGDMEGNGAINA